MLHHVLMVTKMAADEREFRYIVSARLWFQHRTTVLRNAAVAARRARKQAVGEPDEATVVLVWRQDGVSESAA